jgi:hypothetical protein
MGQRQHKLAQLAQPQGDSSLAGSWRCCVLGHAKGAAAAATAQSADQLRIMQPAAPRPM